MSIEQLLILASFVSFTLGYLARDTCLWVSRKDLTKPHDHNDDANIGPPSFS